MKTQVLIATNVLARGIDVMSVNMVVNYDMPYDPVERRPDVETYLHRSGLTVCPFGIALTTLK